MDRFSGNSFLTTVNLELKRAERYRIFVSMVTLDLSFAHKVLPEGGEELQRGILDVVRGNIRAVDQAALVTDGKLALLLPETPRQGAEAAARRVTSMIKQYLIDRMQIAVDRVIPLEMASYPDAAGARSVADMLEELTQTSNN